MRFSSSESSSLNYISASSSYASLSYYTSKSPLLGMYPTIYAGFELVEFFRLAVEELCRVSALRSSSVNPYPTGGWCYLRPCWTLSGVFFFLGLPWEPLC